MKPFFLSKTNWLGIVTFAISLLTYFQGLEWVQQNAQLVSIIGMVIGALTVLLRMLSTEKIKGWFNTPSTNSTQNYVSQGLSIEERFANSLRSISNRLDDINEKLRPATKK